ncbi:CDP-diacylglycerol--glycerol-3-phosphate 3-phosphatidyltransferase, mitochondrial [Nosema granulosis]|uniref:CDP-diacylglycerol--glycerol-3-phosphate 3-phosphatidyltransferase n=1 Tax=Nosema granulosis TaxID=83296 RepID=A0A9P6KZ80_9MICR|nr:CDP-diacylglycerol--glycerol-3-phosphate 3-phosphatidyltransferase, mitochondrial [Nosema granulosis]
MKKLLKSLDEFNIFTLGDVNRLKTPEEFFNVLKEGFIKSKEAYIATMYFGEDEQSNELLQMIENRNDEGKRTIIICDKARGMTEHIKLMIKKHKLFDNFYFKKSSSSLFPSKVSELLSVFHSKIILFDDKAIVTGANVNGSYFNVRLDRYFYTLNTELVNLIIGTVFVPIIQKSKDIGGFNIVSGNVGCVHNSFYASKKGIESQDVFANTLTTILQEQNNPTNVIDMLDYKEISTDPKIIVYDEKSEYSVIEALVDRGFNEIVISTAYLNFPYEYIKLLRKANVKIVVNDPETNIFTEYGNHGSLVTDIYKYSTLRTALNLPKSQIYEFRREGYTMHAKGIWAFTDTVAATMIGSSNMNRRSLNRDTELNFLLVSSREEHVKLFREEVADLLKRSTLRDVKDLQSRDYSLLVILIFILFNSFI